MHKVRMLGAMRCGPAKSVEARMGEGGSSSVRVCMP